MTVELFLGIICLSELFTGGQIHAGVYWFDIIAPLSICIFGADPYLCCVIGCPDCNMSESTMQIKWTRHSTPCNEALLHLYLCRTTDYKMSPSASGVTSRPWTPRCTPPPQQQQPSIPSHPHPHPPPDYHHNVYIPGTPSGFCTLRPTVQRSELDVHNSFSTFGKKRRLQMSPQGEAAIINNDLYNDWLVNKCLIGQ